MENTTVQKSSTVESMFKAGAHFGFSKSRRHPSMSPYIFGIKNKVEIFDLEKTSELLEETKMYLEMCGKERKTVLFVGGKNEARNAVLHAAEAISMPYVAGRWIGGTLTNFSEIKKRLDLLEDLTTKREKGELSKYTKFERMQIDKEIEDLEGTFGGLVGMKTPPHALFVVDTKKEAIAVAEANKMHIPVIGLLNSDCNVRDVDYFFAGNDASLSSISFFLGEAVSAYQKGRAAAPEIKEPTETKGTLSKESNKN